MRIFQFTSTAKPAAKPTATRIKIILTMALCVVGIGAISHQLLINNSLRLDEAQSLWQTSHSLQGTLKVVAQDVHVPLYHIILHYWQILMGQSIETARLLSLGFFVASVPLVYLLARRLLSANWSLFVMVLFSFSPFMNWYGNEARMYSMLVFISLLSQLFFVRLIDSQGRKGWWGFTLTALVGVYTHYFFMFGLMAQGLYYLMTRKQFVKGTFWRFAGLALLLAAWLTPWFLYFRSLGSAGNTSPLLQKPSTVDFFNVFSQFSFGFQTDTVNTILVSTWPLLVVVALLGVKHGQRLNRQAGYILAAALAPVVIAFVISHTLRPFFVSRYMVACLPPLIIFMVWLVSHYGKLLRLAVASGMVLLLVAASWLQYASPATPVKEDFKTAAAYIGSHADARDIVVLSAPFSVYPFNYYYTGAAKVATLPNWDRTVPGSIPPFEAAKLDGEVRGMNDGHRYVYLLLSSDQGYQETVFQHYEQRFENTYSHQFSPDLKLEVYRVGYSVLKPAGEL